MFEQRPEKRPHDIAIRIGLYRVTLTTREARYWAERVARSSTCIRRQVGALVLDEAGRVIGAGWNVETGLHAFAPKKCAKHCPRAKSQVPAYSQYSSGSGRCIARHAEVSALEDAAPLVVGPEHVLVVTDAPCDDCLVEIAKAGCSVIAPPRKV